MTPEQLRDKITFVTARYPLPEPDMKSIGHVMMTRRNLLLGDVEAMDLDELHAVVDDVIGWHKLPTWVTRLIACELIVRLEQEGRGKACGEDLRELSPG